jgi:putative RecB family exonuclease
MSKRAHRDTTSIETSTSDSEAIEPLILPGKLSPSALLRYRTCPKQFFLTDVERLARYEERSVPLAQGNAIHDALRLFYGLDLVYRSAENLERCLRKVWRRHTDGIFQTIDEEIATGRAALAMLEVYAANFDLTIKPLAREQWVGLRLEGIRLNGKVDRLDRGKSGVEIVDYKTGRNKLESDELRHEPAVQVYVLGAEAAFGEPVERVRFIYLVDGTEASLDLEREDVESLGFALQRTLAVLRGDETFEARPSRICDFCPVQLHCTARGRVEIEEIILAPGEEPVF